MKIITIGDLHGRNNWMNFEDINILVKYPNLKTDFDFYIFTGDYCDSFTKTNTEILDNLKTLIRFKKNYPNKVILLLGNHDLSYMFPLSFSRTFSCSGFRPEAYWDLYDFFKENLKYFQTAFQIKNYLWTHAGVHKGWYNFVFKKNWEKLEGFKGVNIADKLNQAFEREEKCLFDCGHARFGSEKQGGPFWADKSETWIKGLEDFHQIVGHSQTKDIMFNKINENTSVTYCDCSEFNKYHVLELE